MTKFVTVVMVLAFTVVFSTAAMAEGWRIGNWEPPKKEQGPVLKAVSLGTFQQPVAPATISVQVQATGCAGVAASCVGVQMNCARATACFQQVGCAGRSGGWFFGRRMQRNRQARASARMGCN